ncbi:hypothetical protein SFC65_19325 [Priestia filamentosa]|uniref:hypothetical protein n=1 Tax=Priestia filamentosa TaxID=1402861 RepID=UPI00398240B3
MKKRMVAAGLVTVLGLTACSNEETKNPEMDTTYEDVKTALKEKKEEATANGVASDLAENKK